MSKIKIKITETNDNVLLYGITTQLDDYKFSWLLNNELNFNFKKNDDYLVTKKGISSELLFSAYTAEIDDNLISLVSNKNENSIKLINISTVDFLLKIHSSNLETENLLARIKALKGIIAITKIKDNPNIPKKIIKEVTDFLK